MDVIGVKLAFGVAPLLRLAACQCSTYTVRRYPPLRWHFLGNSVPRRYLVFG